MTMRLVSWNVNGLRACLNKGFREFVLSDGADAYCLQETKLQAGQLELDLPGYTSYWSYAQKKGYAGTAILTKSLPLSVTEGIGQEAFDQEGRVLTAEYPAFYLVCVYAPNAQDQLARIDFRLAFEEALRAYLQRLDAEKPVVLCGDLNVAHQAIDLKNPGPNRGNAGFSDQERQAFSALLDAGFTDTFRYRYPDVTGAYSWWSYRFRAREHNAGWRIDYFLISDRLRGQIREASILAEVMGSDHCPVALELDVDTPLEPVRKGEV